MYFVFFKFFLILHLLDSLFDVFISTGSIPILEITKRYSVMSIIVLRLDNQCELIPSNGLSIVLLLLIAICKVNHRIKVFLIDSHSLSIGVDSAVQFTLGVVIVALEVPKVSILEVKSPVLELRIWFLFDGRL